MTAAEHLSDAAGGTLHDAPDAVREASIEGLYEGSSIGDLIASAIERYPERIAFVGDGVAWRYDELGRHIGRTMALLRSLGLVRGDGVVQLSGNRPETFVVMAACYFLGLRSVTLHTLASADDHALIVDDADATVFVADAPYAARAEALRSRCAGVAHWFVHGAGTEAGTPVDVAGPGGAAGRPALRDLAAEAAACAPAPLRSEAGWRDVIRLAYTGGTTGRPKGVMLSNRSVVMQAMLMLAGRDLPQEIRFLCPTPISHGAGALIVPCLWRGGTVILQQGFDSGRFLDALEAHRATLTFLVPTMLYRLLDDPTLARRDLSSLQALMYGAAPASPARLREALQVFGPVLSQSFGQTECPSNILLLNQSDHRRVDVDVLGSAGKPYPGVQVRLLDDRDEPVDDGAVGEICVRGPLVMDGYWKQPAQTAAALRNGWLHTGDMAVRDPHGYFHLVDRKKDMIVSGGFNVYPKEIEDVLSAHTGVAAVAVVGVPDAQWGEAVKAVVVPRPEARADAALEAALIARVKQAKGSVHAPKSVDFVEALPLTALGKADKKALRQRYWQGRERAVN